MKYANLTAFQNSFVDEILYFKHNDGTVFDVSEYSFTLVISKHMESVDKIIIDLPHVDALAGEVGLNITSEQTLTIPVGANVYSIFGTHDTLGTLLFQQGTFYMNPTTYIPAV